MPSGRPASTAPGTVIGPYTAVAPTARKRGNAVIWQWRCECGAAYYAVPAALAADQRAKPLSCPHPAPATGRPPSALAGTVCGQLTVVEVARRERNGEYVWRCECECGATTTVRGSRLKARETTMCAECAADRRRTPDGYRIRDARAAAGLSQTELADLLGFSRQRMSQLENHIRVKEIEQILARIAAPSGESE